MSPRSFLVWLTCVSAVQVPLFKSGVETVRVDVLVTRDGRPVADLGPADFEVFDSGVTQRIDHAAFGEIPLNVVLAIDASSSIQGERAQRLRQACHRVLGKLRDGDEVGLVVFGDPVAIRSRLTRDVSAVRAAVDMPFPLGRTALVDAVQASIVTAESGIGRALVLVFSDGIEVSSYLSPDAVLETAKRSDTVVYGVSLQGGRRRSGVLDDLADASGGSLVQIESPDQIEATFERVLEEFRHRYVLSYTPTGVERTGWHEIKVRVKQRGTSVKARAGYLGQ
jgi:Ca-activated chloride channel homolog